MKINKIVMIVATDTNLLMVKILDTFSYCFNFSLRSKYDTFLLFRFIKYKLIIIMISNFREYVVVVALLLKPSL